MPSKHSHAALIRMVEAGIREVGDLPSNRFYILVRDVKVSGSPPTSMQVSVLVRFLPSGSPYCCGEPGCYSSVFRTEGIEELGDYLRRKMNLKHSVTVELKPSVEYYDDIAFTAHSDS